MRLTRFTDYSLRVLMYLAVNEGSLSTIQEIAGCYGVSRNHLMKIVQELARLGLVDTVRGKSGGIRLAMEPEAINLGDVVRNTEPDFNLAECFESETSTCRLQSNCELARALRKATGAFLDVLDGYTLNNLISAPQSIRRMLNLRTAEIRT